MSEWQPIATAPLNTEAFFWVVPKMANEAYCDTRGRPIVSLGSPRMMYGKFGWWSSLEKALYWMPLPAPPPEAER